MNEFQIVQALRKLQGNMFDDLVRHRQRIDRLERQIRYLSILTAILSLSVALNALADVLAK